MTGDIPAGSRTRLTSAWSIATSSANDPVAVNPGWRLALADLLLAGQARGARAAGAHERHGDLVADGPGANTGSDLDHHARRARGPGTCGSAMSSSCPCQPCQSRAAHPRRRDAQDHAVVGTAGCGNVLDRGEGAELGDDDRAHDTHPPGSPRPQNARKDQAPATRVPATGIPRRGAVSGSASSTTRSAGDPTSGTRPRPSTEDSSATRRSSACSGCHGGATVAGPADGGVDGDPRVQGCDGSVRAERQPDTGAVQGAERERAVGAARPSAGRPRPGRPSRARAGCSPRSPGRRTSTRPPADTSWACSIDPVAPDAANASSARAFAASPIAWIAHRRPCRVAWAMSGASREGGTVSMPRASGPVRPGYGSWQ